MDYTSDLQMDNLKHRKDRQKNCPLACIDRRIGDRCFVFFIQVYGLQSPGFAKSPKEPEKSISQITTKNGSKTNLLLPDGTKVWLNAGSSITYDSSYGRTDPRSSLVW